MENKKAQITIFIIIAIVLVVGIAGYLIVKDRVVSSEIPANMEPVYTTFLACLEEETLTGISVLESQGGYIGLPDFEAGSEYMPFGSQLYFLGNPIPYWYYVSGNNLQNEQVPSLKNMESQLGEFVEDEIKTCVFDSYYDEGFQVIFGEPNVEIDIKKNVVEVGLKMDMAIVKGEDSVVVSGHDLEVNSKLGTLYEAAREVYDYEQNTLFLENYAVDNLRLYAPVDGVELTCSPLTWNAEDVFDELQDAIEANTGALKVKGGDYSLRKEENKYFVVDLDVGSDVRFVNSKTWANGFEVNPASGSVLMSEPVGNQQSLGILGFCYVPYHFVYNVRYPVLVQVYEGDEIFQFPIAVVIEGNKPREALKSSAVEEESSEICEYKNTNIEVSTSDSRGNSVDADVFFECFGERCNIGKSEGGFLNDDFPQCVNGYVIASADGFVDTRVLYPSAESGSVDVFMNKLYEMDLSLKLDGNGYGQKAIVNFVSDDISTTVVYPDMRKVELAQGQYEIQVYIYKNSSLRFEDSSMEQCVEVPRSGVGSLFGLTDEKCFQIEVPESLVSNALAGGGKQEHYILESDLVSGTIEINAQSLPTPKSIEELQENYVLFENKGLDVAFK